MRRLIEHIRAVEHFDAEQPQTFSKIYQLASCRIQPEIIEKAIEEIEIAQELNKQLFEGGPQVSKRLQNHLARKGGLKIEKGEFDLINFRLPDYSEGSDYLRRSQVNKNQDLIQLCNKLEERQQQLVDTVQLERDLNNKLMRKLIRSCDYVSREGSFEKEVPKQLRVRPYLAASNYEKNSKVRMLGRLNEGQGQEVEMIERMNLSYNTQNSKNSKVSKRSARREERKQRRVNTYPSQRIQNDKLNSPQGGVIVGGRELSMSKIRKAKTEKYSRKRIDEQIDEKEENTAKSQSIQQDEQNQVTLNNEEFGESVSQEDEKITNRGFKDKKYAEYREEEGEGEGEEEESYGGEEEIERFEREQKDEFEYIETSKNDQNPESEPSMYHSLPQLHQVKLPDSKNILHSQGVKPRKLESFRYSHKRSAKPKAKKSKTLSIYKSASKQQSNSSKKSDRNYRQTYQTGKVDNLIPLSEQSNLKSRKIRFTRISETQNQISSESEEIISGDNAAADHDFDGAINRREFLDMVYMQANAIEDLSNSLGSQKIKDQLRD